MIQTIRVQRTDGKDSLGNSVLKQLHSRGEKKIDSIQTSRVYRLEGISEKEAKFLAEKLFFEPLNQTYAINKPFSPLSSLRDHAMTKQSQPKKIATSLSAPRNDNVQVIEISYKPGVMNPEVASIIKSAHDLGINLQFADSSTEFLFTGAADNKKLIQLINDLRLFNPIVEHIVTEEPKTLQIKGTPGKTTVIKLRAMNNENLMELSQDKLFLNLGEMKIVQEYFKKIKRDPTDCELETIAQTWSEHCAHKTFKANLIVDGKKKEPLMKRLKKEALKHDREIVSAFVDNSGVMDFYDGYAICGKAETHNSPSAIEPYGGAMTGSGGVFRDVVATGQGAKAIVSTDIFCLAPWDMNHNKLPSGCLPPDYMLKRVVEAVRDYGNRVGIPTNNGSFHFHEDFRAKPVVLVGAYGIMPKKFAKKGSAKIGDFAVVIGGRTGRDGIHGATFSSGEMTERTINVNSSAVQIGNAIEEKRTFDAILEARDLRLIRAMQDCGAGGFSSAIGEMGEETGVRVDLQKVPVKYPGLAPWEIWVSESQERMALSVPKTKLKQFLKVCKKYNVEAAVVGKFDGSKKLRVYFGKELVCNLDTKFLFHGLPQRTMLARKPKQLSDRHSGKQSASRISNHAERSWTSQDDKKTEKEWISILKKVLAHPNICSKEPIVRLYDHTVQGTNVLQPYSGEKLDGPNDAAVIRPLLNKPYGMVVSHGLNPVLNSTDPYWGSLWAGVEALANYVAVGGNYKTASLINNYIWPFPDEESLYTLDQSVDAVVDFMKIFKIPVISGKDSLSATYRGKNGFVLKIPPTLCISVFGKIPDVTKTVSSDFKKEGSVIVLLGNQDLRATNSSIYSDVLDRHSGKSAAGDASRIPTHSDRSWTSQDDNTIPHVDIKNLPKLFSTLTTSIQKNKILSCHDISEGGLITALFEMCVGGEIGATIDVPKNISSDLFLFNETAGTFLVEVKDKKTAQTLFKNIPYKVIGTTQKNKKLIINSAHKNLFSVTIAELKKPWQKPMQEIFT